MVGENPLHSHVMGHAADIESPMIALTTDRDYIPFIYLNTLFVAFLNPVMNLNQVSNAKRWPGFFLLSVQLF